MSYIDCPGAQSAWTPCIARDGSMALAEHYASGKKVCVGCEASPISLLGDLAERYEPAIKDLTSNRDKAADALQVRVKEYVDKKARAREEERLTTQIQLVEGKRTTILAQILADKNIDKKALIEIFANAYFEENWCWYGGPNAPAAFSTDVRGHITAVPQIHTESWPTVDEEL